MKTILAAIGENLLKIIFSRKFIGFVVVLWAAWRGFILCLASENPMALGIYGAFAGLVTTAVGIYSFANAKESVGIAQAKTSAPPVP